MSVEVEVSLYPVTGGYAAHPVHDFVEVLKNHGCAVETTPLSSIVTGEPSQVFDALREGYEQASCKGGCVMVAKACNVCPL
jgi:uncharacterized protein YqgV (UPF0045/DUF77 family)